MSDSPVIAFLNKATDLILLNVLWIIFSLPVITIGASTTAMYYVCIVSLRNGDGYVVKRFWKSFCQNFKQATCLWIPMLMLLVLMYFDLMFWYSSGTTFSKIMFCVSAVICLMLTMVMMYLFPVLAKLEGNVKTTIKNAAAFAFGYLPYTAVIILCNIGFVFVNIKSVAMNAITAFVGVALITYIKSFFYYKVFMNHIDERYDDFYTDDNGRDIREE